MNRDDTLRPMFWRGIFYLLLAIGIPLLVVRYTRGLGSVTNLTDEFPWGLWIGFDILCGVGLAAGGFTITAIVYLFHVKRFESIVRPTVLTAFLGYLLVVGALLVDLGRPWNLWRPIVLWNPSSVMFEISWCVMLYTTVLALEVSGMALERFGWTRALRVQRNLTIPLVVAGVILSTLHQSSLGALYLIIPGKLHALWFTTALPLIFVVSSVCAGLAMVIVESHISARAFGRQLELPVLRDVGHLLVAALGVFGVLRLTDLWYQGALVLAFEPTYEALMFQLEFVVGVVLPFALLAVPRIRAASKGLYAAGLLTVLGFIVNRLNVAVTGLEGAAGKHYIPAWSEIVVSVMFVAIGFAAFSWAVRHLNVFPPSKQEPPNPLPFPGSG